MSLQVLTHITIFKETQEAMLDVMTDLHQGHINTKLITPNQLKGQLQQLRAWVPAETRVPDYQQHWVQLFKLLKVKAGMTDSHLIFELSIPLLGLENFQLYRVHPVPTRYETKMVHIMPISPVLLVNLQRTWYYPMEIEDLKECQTWDRGQQICLQKRPLFTVQDEDKPCELRLLQHESKPLEHCQIQSTAAKTYFRPLAQPNHWLVSVPEKETMDIICNDTINHITLQGSGILRLEANCQLKGKGYMVKSLNIHTSQQEVNQFLPQFNISEKVSQMGNLEIMNDLSPDIQVMMESVRSIQAKRSSDVSWNHHDVHHYTVSGFSIVAIAILYLWWWRRQRRHRHVFQQFQPQFKENSGTTSRPRRNSFPA